MTLQMKSLSKQSKIGKLRFNFRFNQFIVGDLILAFMASCLRFFLSSYKSWNSQFLIENEVRVSKPFQV